MKTLLTAALLIIAPPALANVEVNFRESAPKDTFTFTNTGACDLGAATISVNLADSASGLIFDTTGAGAGVEVFQPYQTVAGAEVLTDVSPVKDGDTMITLTLSSLAPNQSVAFTIDVDDTLRNSARGQIQVTDSEIAGATVSLQSAGTQTKGVFDNTSRAMLSAPACTS